MFLQNHPEGLTNLATVDVLFSKAADPQINPVNTLHCVAIDEFNVWVSRFKLSNFCWVIQDQIWIGFLELRNNSIAQAVALLEIGPRCIRTEITCIAHSFVNVGVCRSFEIGAHLVHGAETHIPTTCNVEGKEISPDAHEIITHCINYVEINFFRLLGCYAAEDVANTKLSVTWLWHIAWWQMRIANKSCVGRIKECIHQLHLHGLAVSAHHC